MVLSWYEILLPTYSYSSMYILKDNGTSVHGKEGRNLLFISQNLLGIAISAHGFKCIFVQTKDGFKDYLQLVFCNVTKKRVFFSTKSIFRVLPLFFSPHFFFTKSVANIDQK